MFHRLLLLNWSDCVINLFAKLSQPNLAVGSSSYILFTVASQGKHLYFLFSTLTLKYAYYSLLIP